MATGASDGANDRVTDGASDGASNGAKSAANDSANEGAARLTGRGRRTIRHIWLHVRTRRREIVIGAAIVVLGLVLLRILIPPAVTVVTLETAPVVETLVITGRVRGESRAGVGAPVGGTVSRVLVEEGDRVERGELLLQLDDDEARATAAGARARLAEANAALGRVAVVTLPTSAAELEAASLEAQHLERDAQRVRRLYEAGAVALIELEEAQRLAESAQARLTAARSATRAAADGGADREAAEAAVVAARAAVDAANAGVELTRVRAPASGTVLTRDVEPGDVVTPGRVLMQLSQDGPTEIFIYPDERVLGRLRIGLNAVVAADAFPDRHFDATISHIAPVVDSLQGTIEVRLAVPAPPPFLMPDMTVSVNVELARRDAARTVPLHAVESAAGDSAWVFVVRDGRTVRVPVQLGVRDTLRVEVLRGLQAEDRVVLDPMSVEEDARVRARRR